MLSSAYENGKGTDGGHLEEGQLVMSQISPNAATGAKPPLFRTVNQRQLALHSRDLAGISWPLATSQILRT